LTDRLTTYAALLTPAAVAIYLGFSSGGFFPGSTALAVLIFLLVLGVRVLTAEHPVAGVNLGTVVTAAALTAFGIWILISFIWSDAASRSLLEFDRAFLYVLAFLLTALLLRSRLTVQTLVWGVGIAIVVVAGAALLTRVFPDVFPTHPAISPGRLSFPLTYWNGVGIVAAFGVILTFAIASDRAQPSFARIAGATLFVPMCATLYFTFSRGGIAAAILGAVIFLSVGRPRSSLTTMLAVLPATAVTMVVCYDADLLGTEDFASSKGVDQGHTVALVILGAMVAAGLLQALLVRFDQPLADWRLPERARVPTLVTAAVASLAVLLAAVALDAPGEIRDHVDHFVNGGDEKDTGADARTHLTDLTSNSRIDHWTVALDAWKEHPVDGSGAGTFALLWAKDRPVDFTVIDGHSLYIEVMSEMGTIGLLLVLAFVGCMIVGAARRCRGPDRVLYAAVLAVIVAWAVHAGVDWDWEQPAVTVLPIALAGAVLASRRPRVAPPGRVLRVSVGIGLLVLAITPFSIARSQRDLNQAVAAVKAGDCTKGTDDALNSIDALKIRPEPYELLAYCNADGGRYDLAEQMARAAIDRDPNNWEFHYDLALVRASAGKDPRAAARKALELNPLDSRVVNLERAVTSTDSREQWEATGQAAPRLLP
jgi:O-Antigen ligase